MSNFHLCTNEKMKCWGCWSLVVGVVVAAVVECFIHLSLYFYTYVCIFNLVEQANRHSILKPLQGSDFFKTMYKIAEKL